MKKNLPSIAGSLGVLTLLASSFCATPTAAAQTSGSSACSSGTPTITSSEVAYFATAGTTGNLREFFCVSSTAPLNAPSFSGSKLSAYRWLSNQLYPGSEGNIRGLYNSVNINWGTLDWPSYSSSCNCGGKADFDAVKSQIKKEIEAVADIGALFEAMSTYYLTPLFIAKGAIAAGVISTIDLPDATAVTVHTGSVIGNTLLGTLDKVANAVAGDFSPWAPIALSALMNLSRSENGGSVPHSIDVKIASLNDHLSTTFEELSTQASQLRSSIIADYSLYMAIGLDSSSVTEKQMTKLQDAAGTAYKKQLYTDLIPYRTNIVYYSPADDHLGGGGHVYTGQDASSYSASTPQGQVVDYLHDAGYLWSKKTNYQTTSMLLTSNATYDSGDFVSGALCANNMLSLELYKAVFTDLGFTYPELLSLGIGTKVQCSLCDDSDCNYAQCRSNNSCR